MMIEEILTSLLRHWPTAILILTITYLAKNRYHNGLQKYPGPVLASLTDWWRFFDVLGRRPDITHINLHKKHGDIVRYGPNALSFANPQALKTIYGLNKGFVKVRVRNDHGDYMVLNRHKVRFLPRPTSHVKRRAPSLSLLNNRRAIPRRAPPLRQQCLLNVLTRSIRTLCRYHNSNVPRPDRSVVHFSEQSLRLRRVAAILCF